MSDFTGYVPPLSPAQYQERDQLDALYNKFNQSVPSLTQDLYSNATEKANRDVTGQVRNIRAGASQRGLLYSGLREGAEGAAKAKSASDLSNQKASINENMLDQDYQLGNMAANSGLDLNTQEFQRSQARYNLALRQAGQRADVMGGLFGAAGLLGGAALASKMGSKSTDGGTTGGSQDATMSPYE